MRKHRPARTPHSMPHGILVTILTMAICIQARAGLRAASSQDTLPPKTIQTQEVPRSRSGTDTSRPLSRVAGDSTMPVRRDSLTILGVGDIMLGTDFPKKEYLPPDDGANLLKPVRSYIREADISFGNLEGTLLSGDHPGKKCKDSLVCYAFKMPDHYARYLTEAGFDVMSVANNHINDFGLKGSRNTVEVLEREGIRYAGLGFCPTTVFRVDDLTIGFTAFAPNTGTLDFNDHASAARIVRALDSVCDIVIVSFHGGAEGATQTHVTRQDEMFVGENRGNPYRFARAVIDAGADIVFGHGPHVTRAIDLYRDRLICYSLGNFATYGRFNLAGVSGIAPMVTVTVNRKGEFQSARVRSIRQPGEGGPVIDEQQRALKELMQLTRTDIPEAPLLISMDGIVRKKPKAGECSECGKARADMKTAGKDGKPSGNPTDGE
jgi:poly-gamma-glutamate capsule biosynthesis protein CapA/YwtB (metallophosphatase superfamily)